MLNLRQHAPKDQAIDPDFRSVFYSSLYSSFSDSSIVFRVTPFLAVAQFAEADGVAVSAADLVEVADGASILLVNADGERMAATHLEFEQWCELGWVRPVPRSAHEELERLMRE